MTHPNLLVELLVEELPPKALQKLGDAFGSVLLAQLQAQGLADAHAQLTCYASPRRLAAHITDVAQQAADKPGVHKLMPLSVGLDANGQPTAALLKKLAALGLDVAVVPDLKRIHDGKTEVLLFESMAHGVVLADGLQQALDDTLAKLPIPKVMRYQLQDGWSSVQFVRPAHGLLALHGGEVLLSVQALGLTAGNTTQGHRFEAATDLLVIRHADSYAEQLAQEGAVIASFTARRAEIVRQLQAAAAQVSANTGSLVQPIDDAALLDEVTALVERPNVVVCAFEREFLNVPQECLILTMKANQKYFPLLDCEGKLTHYFLVVSNISPPDTSAVIGGNERVIRPRLADAQFFFNQDRKHTLASRVAALDKVVYHNRLGSQGERVQRVRQIAKAIAEPLYAALLVRHDLQDTQDGEVALDYLMTCVDNAALLAKADLLTDMVGEFPELQGIMGSYYAVADGLPDEVAHAIEDHYKPRFAGDSLPRQHVGLIVALADKLETLTGMFGTGNLPTGERDPFALRRHALGIIRMLMEKELPLDLGALLASAVPAFGDKIEDATAQLLEFFYDRLTVRLREQGWQTREVEAVLALRPQRLLQVPRQLEAVRAFTALPEAPALAAANKRIGNILKKAGEVDAHVNPDLLHEPAEKDLYAALQRFVPEANAQFEHGDYTASLQTLAVLRAPVDAFFDDVMVNAEDLALRLNRQGLLKTLHIAMNRVADLAYLTV